MSRIEATIPDPRLKQVQDLEAELGLSKSQIVDEALALLFKAVAETRQGKRVGFVGSQGQVTEFSSPSLSLLEWAVDRNPIVLTNSSFERVVEMTSAPARANAALKRASRRRKG
jgi:hypothetical protein